jgi:hypothetical protein
VPKFAVLDREGRETHVALDGSQPHRSGRASDFALEATSVARVEEGCAFDDYEVTVRYEGSAARDAGIRISVGLSGDSDPHWLIPGAWYGENRPASCRRIYPRWSMTKDVDDELVSDTWSIRTDRASLPSVFGWNDDTCVGLALAEETAVGLAGVGFGVKNGPTVWIDAPYREEPSVFFGDAVARPPDVRMHRYLPGDVVRLGFQLYVGPGDPHAYDAFLRAMYARRRDTNRLHPWMGAEDAAAHTAHGLYTWHYRKKERLLYETVSFHRELDGDSAGLGDRPNMHVSWISGIPYAYALLRYGRAHSVDRYVAAGLDVIDFIAGEGVSPSGLFYGEWRGDRKAWTAGWNGNRRWLHARTLAEATLFLVRAIASERERGIAHQTWDHAVRTNLETVLRVQRDDGNLGMYYDLETGDVQEWDGAAGIQWIAALAEGAKLMTDNRYLDVAQRAGVYYRRFVDAQFINGAPEDVHLAPTSEDGFNAVMAYVALHESDPAGGWLDLARRSADWMLTWRWAYNTTFPEHSLLREYDFRTRGGDGASSAIEIIHCYGLICLPEMARLARHTKDAYYLQRTQDNLACFLQFVARQDGDFNAYRGMVTERYYHTNAFQQKGMLLNLSHAWCVGAVLYAAQEALAYPELLEVLPRP